MKEYIVEAYFHSPNKIAALIKFSAAPPFFLQPNKALLKIER
ncbi:hypothetical protein BAOM_1698 [Peribacillus asahii]|uniref:Uncharacterized protein n=1 Tax=Peribacillus asahii TaxID=228899 RepID=A0A3T0KPV3_9BACI|nr:hypothetical protein BAOM_1698 [Peribacillus asahii]